MDVGVMDLTRIALVIAVVGFVIAKRFKGEQVAAKRLAILPVVLTVIGFTDFRHSVGGALSALDMGALVACGAISLAIGALRGTTIELSERGGYLWQRYRVATLGVWAVALVARLAEMLVGHAVGASAVTGGNSLLLMLGLTLVGEGAMLALRASTSGIPFAPEAARS
jgi:hypothetical protein